MPFQVAFSKISFSFSFAAQMAINGNFRNVFGPHFTDPYSVLADGPFAFLKVAFISLFVVSSHICDLKSESVE